MVYQKIHHYPCSSSTECHHIEVTLPRGNYLIECYGAQGGKGMTNGQYLYPGGKGAYTSGILILKQKTSLFLYIGGKGDDASFDIKNAKGGWNGGGSAGADLGNGQIGDYDDPAGAGGGSTDVRLVEGMWDDEESINSRIMVAAGGSGSGYNTYGAPGGDLHGYITRVYQKEEYIPSETNQVQGYKKGRGQDGDDCYYAPETGAGSGYYGGYKGESYNTEPYPDKYYLSVSSSGSSYVSGYPGCSESIYKFLEPCIWNGFSSFPSLNESISETGHEGNGAVRITKLKDFHRTQPRGSLSEIRRHKVLLF